MALTPVTRHLGLFGLLVPLLGCADGVELLSSNEQSGFAGLFAAGGEPVGQAAAPNTASGGAFGQAAAPSAASGGIGGIGGSPVGGRGGTTSGVACRVDGDCAFASEWCEASVCVSCRSDLPTCEHGWSARAFSRNGCMQFACAPPSACHSSSDCSRTQICYGGETCDEGCAPGDPLCCEGNFCASPGCDGAMVPLSCTERGCPLGERCVGADWTPPDCDCVGGDWVCRTAPDASQCQ